MVFVNAMRAPSPALPPRTPPVPFVSGSRSFSLVEIAVAVLIVGLLAAICVPRLKNYVVRARSRAVINDLRVFSQAYHHYLQENGDWPSGSSTPSRFPKGMERYLRESRWTHPTPIGGYYMWETNVVQGGQHVRAAISIISANGSAVTSDRIQLADIDKRLDDGNLSTGSFRLGFYNDPVYVIEY